MSDSRIHNSIRNIKWGLAHKMINILIPFIIRTIIIYKLGIEYVGINSLFTSMLSVLTLSELGFESAVVIIMYNEVASGAKDRIGALLLFLKRVYMIVGGLILLTGFVLFPFLDIFIKDLNEVPDNVNIHIIYLIFLVNASISYFFGGYRQSQLVAYQRNDIISKVTIVTYIIFSFAQMAVLFAFSSYYIYIILLPINTLITNLWLKQKAKKSKKDIELKGSITKRDKARIKKLVLGSGLAKLGAILCSTLDSVVISSFLGISILGLYNNYYYIVSAVIILVRVVYISIQGSVGNSIVIESIEKNLNDMKVLNFGYNWILVWCSFCIVFLIQPFMAVWLGFDYLLPEYLCVILGLFLYISESISLVNIYKYAKGILWEDWYRPLVVGFANLGLNILIVLSLRDYDEKLALTGVLISSIVIYFFINNPWIAQITFKHYFIEGFKDFYLKHSAWLFVFITLVAVSSPVYNFFPVITGRDGYVNFGVRILISVILPNLIMICIFRKNPLFKALINRFIRK